MDEVIDPAMTVKVTGFYINFLNTYMSSFKYLKFGGLKLYILYMNKFSFYYKLIKKNSLFKVNNFHILVKAKNRIGFHN